MSSDLEFLFTSLGFNIVSTNIVDWDLKIMCEYYKILCRNLKKYIVLWMY